MKKSLFYILALVLALSISAGATAAATDTADAPDFNVSTIIFPDSLTVYQGQPVNFTAVTTYSSVKNDGQMLQFVSDKWAGTDTSTPAADTKLAVSSESATDSFKPVQVFTGTASLFVSDEPGEYSVRITYSITLQNDLAGVRTYKTVTTSSCFPVDVLEGKAEVLTDDAEAADGTIPTVAAVLADGTAATGETAANADALAQEGPLNHGQIVSAWAHWKQTKGNEFFLSGGPGVFRSLNWYKTQVEDKTFNSTQEVYNYLDSIYEPQDLHVKKDENPDKGNTGVTNDNPNKDNNNAGGNADNPNKDKDNPGANPEKP